MDIERAFDDRPFLDVVSLLAAKKESGRLKITDGTTRGAFFFNNGKLVDAHMGPFSGFQAVNLAISIGRARLSFDSAIQSPGSSFKVPRERIILKERFGIETDSPEACDEPVSSSHEQATIISERAPTSEASFTQATGENEAPGETAQPKITGEFRSVRLPAIPALTRAQPNRKTASVKPAFVWVVRRLLTRSSRLPMIVLLGGLILIVAISTTVGVASYWNKSRQIRPPDLSSSNVAVPLSASSPSQIEEKEPKLQAEGVSSPLPQLNRAPTDPPSPVKPDTRLSADSLQKDSSAATEESSAAKVLPEESSAKPSSRTIEVVVEIDDGQVTEASINKPQPGLGFYEASALRLARQRRFPKGTTRRETITLQVTREP